MIEVKNVAKDFGSFHALDGATLTVPDGAIYGLVGPNGAGKSTLIRHLMGIYRPTSGEILVDGENVWENAAVKEKVVSIPDDWYYFLQSDVHEMMKFYRGFYPKFNMEMYEKGKKAFEIDEKRTIRRLSKGMQKQVAFWLTMCTMPAYLVLDEPVDGLDPVMRRQVWGMIMDMVSEYNTTVLVSSHNLRELEDVCDHVGIINKGKVMLEHSLSELQDNTTKIQVVFSDERPDIPSDLDVLHRSAVGRVQTLIIRGNAGAIQDRIALCQPLFMDVVPLTLEEIFIYELGGVGYAVKDEIL